MSLSQLLKTLLFDIAEIREVTFLDYFDFPEINDEVLWQLARSLATLKGLRHMTIIIANKKSKPDNLRKKFGDDIEIIDVTSKAVEPWVHFSPFWPHGNIPVPFSDGVVATCVEGVWQALKVFESQERRRVQVARHEYEGAKTNCRSLGNVRGHRKGLNGTELLAYRKARELIYLPIYKWI